MKITSGTDACCRNPDERTIKIFVFDQDAVTAKRKVVRKNCEISRQQVADERPVEPYNIKALSPGVPSTQPKHSEFIPWEYLNLGWSEYGVWQTINHSSPAAFGQLVSDYAFGKNDGTTYGTSQVIEPPTSDYLQNAPEELPSNPILDHAGDQVVASQRTVPHTEYAISSLHNRLDNHTRNLTLSRNIQATEAEAGPILALLSKGQKDCPICPYRQTKERMPELRRHVKTHFRKTSDNQCRRVLNTAGMWIGGCGSIFSRKDALKRHLKRGSCGKKC